MDALTFFYLQITYQHLEPINEKQKLMILVELLLENALVNSAHPHALTKTPTAPVECQHP